MADKLKRSGQLSLYSSTHTFRQCPGKQLLVRQAGRLAGRLAMNMVAG